MPGVLRRDAGRPCKRAVEARASSHRGYSYEGGLSSALAEAGIRNGPAWGPALGYLWVSEGSHAGRAKGGLIYLRAVEPGQLRVIPLDPLVAGLGDYDFAVTPPWRKEVWLDPESNHLFGVLTRTDDHTMAALPDTAIMKRWWKHMADIMETHPDNVPVQVQLKRVFYLP